MKSRTLIVLLVVHLLFTYSEGVLNPLLWSYGTRAFEAFLLIAIMMIINFSDDEKD